MVRGLFLGRFQPLHNGHLAAIRESASQVGELYIGIGSSQESRTERNPYSGDQRLRMVEAATSGLPKIKIVLIPDIPGRDDEWMKYIERTLPQLDVIFTGNDDTKKLFEAHGYKVASVTIAPGVSGTVIRELMKGNDPWEHLVPATTREVMREKIA